MPVPLKVAQGIDPSFLSNSHPRVGDGFPGPCMRHCNVICEYKNIGDVISSNYKFSSQMPSLVLSLIDDLEFTGTVLLQLLGMGRDEAERVKDEKGIKICTIIQASEKYFEFIGSKYNWTYDPDYVTKSGWNLQMSNGDE